MFYCIYHVADKPDIVIRRVPRARIGAGGQKAAEDSSNIATRGCFVAEILSAAIRLGKPVDAWKRSMTGTALFPFPMSAFVLN